MKLAVTALAIGAIFTAAAMAANDDNNAQSKAPGQQMQDKGSVKGTTGASGHAPGQQMQDKGSVKGTTGASGYAPGQSNTGSSGSKNSSPGK